MPTPPDSTSLEQQVLAVLATVSSAVEDLRKDVHRGNANIEVLKKSLQQLRADYFNRVGALEQRIGNTRREIRDGTRTASENDLKLESEQAAIIIRLDETKAIAEKALRATTILQSTSRETATTTSLVEKETKAQTPVLADIKHDVEIARKNKLAPLLASLLNLVIGIVWLLLYILKNKP